MSIPNTSPPPQTPAPTEAAGAAKPAAEKPATAAGFLALIGALLQGTAAPDASDVLIEGAASDVKTGDDDGDAEDPADPSDILASLGLTAFLPTTAAPVAAAGAGAGSEAIQPGIAALQGKGAEGTEGATGSGAGVAGAAPGVDALLATAVDDAESDLSGTLTDQGKSGSGATPAEQNPSPGSAPSPVGGWAAAANRIADAQTANGRGTDVTGDGSLRETVGAARWREELGAHLTLMAVRGQQSGSLRLSPEHLGPLEVQITVGDDQKANVQFGAQHAETRDALQLALPRLREMFASAGLQLGDAGVSRQAPQQRPDEIRPPPAFGAGSDGELTPIARSVRSITHSGLLDTYA